MQKKNGLQQNAQIYKYCNCTPLYQREFDNKWMHVDLFSSDGLFWLNWLMTKKELWIKKKIAMGLWCLYTLSDEHGFLSESTMDFLR